MSILIILKIAVGMFELELKFLKYWGGIDYEKSEKVNLVYNDCRYSYSDYHIYCHCK